MAYFVFDNVSDEAIYNHVDQFNSFSESQSLFVQNETVLQLRDELLRTNRFCKELNFIGNIVTSLDTESDNNKFVKVYDVRTSLRNKVEYFDVAHIACDHATGEKILSVNLQNGRTGYVDMDSWKVEPLSYPLFFPYGECGWGTDDGKNIPYNKYLASRLLRPEVIGFTSMEGGSGRVYLTAPHKSDFDEIDNDQIPVQLRTNRFQICSRLAQVYAVDMVSRVIDRRLNFIIRNQDAIKLGQKWKSKYDDDNESDDDDDNDIDDTDDYNDQDFVNAEQRAKEIFLPSSFHGSPRHRKKLALNALVVVTEKGKPTLFITGTCNINWPEIQSVLLKAQTAFDRMDTVIQVFRMRLSKFIHNLRHG